MRSKALKIANAKNKNTENESEQDKSEKHKNTNSQLCSGNNPLPSGSSQRKERLIIFQREDEVYPRGNWEGVLLLHSIPSARNYFKN